MKSDLLYVEHILECIRRIEEYTGGLRDSSAYQQVRAFRNILVHQYLGIDLEFVWSVIADDLPALREKAILLRNHLTSSD